MQQRDGQVTQTDARGDRAPAGQTRAALRALPRVDDLASSPEVRAVCADAPHDLVVASVRRFLQEERARILAGCAALAPAALPAACADRVAGDVLPHLRCAVNASGVVVHTNLGRAPLARRVADHVADVAAHYSTLEFDVETGARGSRHDHVAQLICRLTGAEDAAVVNNNAAAVFLVLSEFARGREAVVSRGELVEIGGSFRIPDIMAMSGARMVEVGTTNKTHLADYERAVTSETSLVLKVHPSNYRVVGFHEEVDVRDLTALAHERGAMVYEDQGSGSFVDLAAAGIGAGEHTPRWSLAQGVDLVSFSGDKLLGAGQAGIVVGSRELVARIKKNPLMRALRPDKMTLAALEETMRAYLDGDAAWREIPVLRMMKADPADLRARACRLFERVAARAQGTPGVSAADGTAGGGLPRLRAGAARLEVARVASVVGGGSLPTTELEGYALRLSVDGVAPNELRARLVARRPRPVVARVEDVFLVCDVRTLVDGRDEDDLVEALCDVMADATPDARACGAEGGGR